MEREQEQGSPQGSVETSREELRREGRSGEREKRPVESLRTLSRRGNTGPVRDFGASKLSPHTLKLLPGSPRHRGSVAVGRGGPEAAAGPSGGAHRHPQPRVARARDALKSQIPELSLSGWEGLCWLPEDTNP